MVSSLDGIIAKKDNSVSWFETSDNYEKGIGISEQDSAKFLKTIDCYVMGAYGHKPNTPWSFQDHMDGLMETRRPLW